MNKLTQTLVLIGTLAGIATSLAQTQPAPAQPSWADKIKKPTDWLTWGADFRLRNEYFDNALTLNPNVRLHEQDYFRFRGRVYATIKALENLSFNVRLTAEPRYWVKDAGYGAIRGNHGADWQEGVIDNLYVKWANVLQQPLTLTIGRQDLRFGDGWLVMDGTPLDGSRTFFLDAARATWELKDHNTTIDLVYVDMSAMNDAWLPTLNHEPKAFTDQEERGGILYIANKSVKEMNLDAYFMYKHDHDPATAQGVRGDLYTPGLRLSGALGDHWKYRAEGALQFGEQQNARLGNTDYHDVMAFGFNSRLSYLLKDKLNNQFHFDYEYLSGDDPGTGKIESFDVLWARWPRFSEMYIYNYAAETRIAQLGNLHRFGPAWTLNPMKKMDVMVAYNLFYADQPDPSLSTAGVFANTGHFRGHYLQGILKYQFSKFVSGHLWAEYLAPGNFYTFQRANTFLRAELLFTF